MDTTDAAPTCSLSCGDIISFAAAQLDYIPMAFIPRVRVCLSNKQWHAYLLMACCLGVAGEVTNMYSYLPAHVRAQRRGLLVRRPRQLAMMAVAIGMYVDCSWNAEERFQCT